VCGEASGKENERDDDQTDERTDDEAEDQGKPILFATEILDQLDNSLWKSRELTAAHLGKLSGAARDGRQYA